MYSFDELDFIAATALFTGIEPRDISSMLACFKSFKRRYPKGAYLQRAGSPAEKVGLLLRGSAQIVTEDFWGRRSILSRLTPGEMFAEAFCFAGLERLPLSVISTEEAEALLMDFSALASLCAESCLGHRRLMSNLLRVLSQKNVALTAKIGHLSRPGTREKLLSYLSAQAQAAGSADFTIAFDRQELADYLSVDRSAMSAELGKLRRQGLLEFKKNRFSLKNHRPGEAASI